MGAASLFTFVLLLLACAAGTLAQSTGDAGPPEKHKTSHATESTPHTSPTTEPTTTPAPTTTHTSEPTHPTTTHEPTTTNATTESPTTPKPTTAGPTSPPTTTTTLAPPPEWPKTGTWKIHNATNFTCFEMDAQAKFNIKEGNETTQINISPNATTDSECSIDDQEQTLKLKWSDRGDTYTANFLFTKKNGTDKEEKQMVVLSNVTLWKDAGTKKQQILAYLNKSDSDLFAAHVGNSYQCNAKAMIYLDNGSNLQVQSLHVQAFMNNEFGKAEECNADSTTNDIVPIAVGCALAGLVVIVLIAYVVGRRLSRKRGYQSV